MQSSLRFLFKQPAVILGCLLRAMVLLTEDMSSRIDMVQGLLPSV